MQPNRQTEAIDTLHDTSDYTSYVEQRVSQLDRLYQTINFTKLKQTSLSHKMKKTVTGNTKKTPRDWLQSGRYSTPLSFPSMYSTQYKQNRARQNRQRIRQRSSLDQYSTNSSFYRNSYDSPFWRHQIGSKKVNDKHRLELYTQTKKQMLNTFYVGQKPTNIISNSKRKKVIKLPQFKLQPTRAIRGKIWHGRPPVKIIAEIQ